MIDTVMVKYNTIVPKDLLGFWIRNRRDVPGGRFTQFYSLQIVLGERVTCTFRYYPHSFTRQPLLTVELSLPNVVFGNNYNMLYDIEKGVSLANAALAKIPSIPKLDLWEGVIIRLDICYNHQVGDLVPYYIKAMRELTYSHRRTMPYGLEGVQFQSRFVTTKFYDKQRECGDPKAHGILRQEITLRGKPLVKLFGKKKPTLQDVEIDNIHKALTEDLKKLDLFERSIATRDTALASLCSAFGELGGFFYFGLLMAKVKEPSKEALAKAGVLHPRTLDRRLKKIVEEVGPLTLTTHEEPLPELTISMRDAVAYFNQEHLSESIK